MTATATNEELIRAGAEVVGWPFAKYARQFWTIYDKRGRFVPFELFPSQRIMLAKLKAQRDAGQPGRLRVLKYRQAGCSLLWRSYVLRQVLTRTGCTAISIADKKSLPEQWLRSLKRLVTQVQQQVTPFPILDASNANELYFGEIASRYSIGSAEGQTPGMGETIRVVHCSEIASWARPDAILSDLLPAVPPDKYTLVVQESTGRAWGDWWFQRYHEAKDGEEGYAACFLPWYIQPEYKIKGRTWADLAPLSERERDTVAGAAEYAKGDGALIGFEGVTPEQMAWRRWMLATEFHGDEDLFANQYPATEEEAFLSGGQQVFTPDQVRAARATIRKPKWIGDIFPGSNPAEYRLEGNESGQLRIWEDPLPGRHYVIGADVQWGVKETADYDACYVQCLETNRIVAAYHGQLDMGRWAMVLSSLGHHYNCGTLAPERNAQAATGVVTVLRGLAGNSWHYPNIWIRSDDLKLKAYRPEDYGFYTNEHTKFEIIAFAKEQTLAEGFDWADEAGVDEMAAYVRDDKGKLTAPEGAHDDRLMARMITAYVAHRVRPSTDLYTEPEPQKLEMTSVHQRMVAMMDGDENE